MTSVSGHYVNFTWDHLAYFPSVLSNRSIKESPSHLSRDGVSLFIIGSNNRLSMSQMA